MDKDKALKARVLEMLDIFIRACLKNKNCIKTPYMV